MRKATVSVDFSVPYFTLDINIPDEIDTEVEMNGIIEDEIMRKIRDYFLWDIEKIERE